MSVSLGGRRSPCWATAVIAVSALVAGCTGPGPGPNPGEGSSGSLSLLSYNVAGLPQEISTENPSEHIPLISPLLNDYDVVLTQEDFDWWTPALDGLDFVHYHERLRAQATHEYRSARHPGPEAAGLDPATRPTLNVGDGLGVLSRFPFRDERRIAWTGCFGGFDTSDGGAADCLAMKGFGVVTMEPAPGVVVDVYDLHGEAGGTAEDQRLQAADFDQLAAYIEANSAGRAVILAGDTNLHTAGDHPDASGDGDAAIWRDFLQRTGLTDACAALDCDEPGSIDKAAVRSGGGVTLRPTSIDYPRERFRSPAGEDLSDHPPLVLEIDWRKKRNR